MSELQYLEVERHDAVALVRLNRPEVLNALCMGLMQEMAEAATKANTKVFEETSAKVEEAIANIKKA